MAGTPPPREEGHHRHPQNEQTERLLQQMQKCVLVHHQLSCLLIHGAALQAGLYSDDGSSAAADGNASDGDEPDSAIRTVQRSIEAIGGSTARLFSKALREPKDLEAMGETLQERVNSMIRGIQGELEISDVGNVPFMDSWGLMEPTSGGAACVHVPPPTASTQPPEPRGADGVGAAISREAAASTEEIAAEAAASADAAECQALHRECERLSSEIAAERREASELAAAIEREREEALFAQRGAAEASFAEARQAECRNEALLRLVEQLEACDMDNPPDEAFLRECALELESLSVPVGWRDSSLSCGDASDGAEAPAL
eukprot:CAMPEP_0170204054 /NCGR_PEP_ID=MMETSP0116_2-20130129/1542_1 /TAXON_ID=400756 /ORGANISM="Durinskia baltica, Strain CSIRO CS-38" /LENGTH=317 /DNA_ID=CAMNT_0010454387 /DNA_START=1 /DNA_END=951 /DNA_ORIENTATION=+